MASDNQKSKAQTFFQYGNDAAMKNNHDYAIQMYREACKIDPENLIFRQALRGIERRKFGNDPAKVGKLVGMRTNSIRLKAKASKGKNWAHVLELCEEAFVHNPWDVGVARDAAEASEALGYKLLAQWLAESVQGQATDAEFFRFQAHIHEINESWQKAIQSWEKVKSLDPNDEMAMRKINALSANATIQRAGLNEAVDKRMEAKQTSTGPDPAELEEMKRQQLSPEERFQKEIQENPQRIGPYLELADHYKRRNQLDEAEKALARGLKANPDDETLQQSHAEVQISRLQQAIEAWTKRSRERPGDEKAKSNREQLQEKLTLYEIKEFRRRLGLHPDDQALQLQLGMRLAKAGKHDEAIAAYQQARNNPALKVEALHQIGLSFETLGNLKLAERSYQDALKAAVPDDTKTFNELHYRLGRVAEAQGNAAIAEEHYNEVAANDYSYLDVAQRLKNLGS
jgi:tetratricopeptide (TPR) repeat protein